MFIYKRTRMYQCSPQTCPYWQEASCTMFSFKFAIWNKLHSDTCPDRHVVEFTNCNLTRVYIDVLCPVQTFNHGCPFWQVATSTNLHIICVNIDTYLHCANFNWYVSKLTHIKQIKTWFYTCHYLHVLVHYYFQLYTCPRRNASNSTKMIVHMSVLTVLKRTKLITHV